MTTYTSKSLVTYNKMFARGEVDDAFVEVRGEGYINIDCNYCGSHLCESENCPIITNGISNMKHVYCSNCGNSAYRRTNEERDE